VSEVRVVALDDVDPIPLPNGSWSRILVSSSTVEDNVSSLGYSIFTPGSETDHLSHAVEELAFVVAGNGELRLDDTVLALPSESAVFIPAHVWHTVVNNGDEDFVMVFAFPDRGYPPTERGVTPSSSDGGA